MLQRGDKIGMICCSNGQKEEYRHRLEQLNDRLLVLGLCPVWSQHIFEKVNEASGTAKERAGSLMDFYRDVEIKAIFDISGGDIANEILPYLDFDIIAKTDKEFWGYSDLTTILNAIYTKTQKTSVLYQVRNLIYSYNEKQIPDFEGYIFSEKKDFLTFPYRFVRGTELDGTVVGGNIRCFLKLAGTEYFPDVTDKILLLEAMSGGMPQMITYLSQLQQMGVFHKVRGILLGTFTKYEENADYPPIEELVLQYVPDHLPIVKTQMIGHGTDSKAVRIGEKICIGSNCII